MSDRMVDLFERQMLMLQGLPVGGLQLVQQARDRGVRCDGRADRHRVDQQAHHRFRPDEVRWPTRYRGAERNIGLAGQPHQQLSPCGL